MRGKTLAAFVFGLAIGALGLALGLWRSGSLVTVKTTNISPSTMSPPASNFGEVVADLGKKTPPPPTPPEPEPFDFSQPLPPAANPPAATPPELPTPLAGNRSMPIGPPPPARHNEADRIAPDRMSPLPHLALPLPRIDPKTLADTFRDKRDGRTHEALDIMAPKGTPVMAVAQGNVAKLFTSKDGGLTVYQFDDTRTYCYYYAHLDRYAPGLQDGTLLRKGQVLGYVGSTGNASPSTPHLHFAVFKLGPEKKWWEGTPIDPLPMFR